MITKKESTKHFLKKTGDKLFIEIEVVDDPDIVVEHEPKTVVMIKKYISEPELQTEFLDFSTNLNKLTKKELIDFIGDFWRTIKIEAINQIKDKNNFRQEEYGRLKMTQMNHLKYKLHYLVENK